MAYFSIGGGRIHYEVHGEGGTPLVFVHGLACALGDWRRQVTRFAPSRCTVSLDQRRHGLSDGHDSGFDVPTFGADLAALVSELRLPPAVLVGHSFGCRVVLECARKFPDRVAGLMLIDGSRLATESAEAARHATRMAMCNAGYEAFMQRLFVQMFTADSDPEVRDALVARAGRLDPAVGLELTPAMVAWDAVFAEEALESVRVPMTVVQSTYLNEDRERVSIRPGQTVPWLELVSKRAPRAEIDIITGVGHFTMIEAADAVNAHIETLLRALGEKGDSLRISR